MNGWQDVDITYSGSYGLRHQGKMHCGVEYDTQCPFDSASWSCDDPDAYCNEVVSPETPTPTDAPAVSSTAVNTDYTEPVDIDTDTNTVDTDDYISNYNTTKYIKFNPADAKDNYENTSLGMILISIGLLGMAALCVLCGAIRKYCDKAHRKLSNMGIKSPFKSPFKSPYRGPPRMNSHGHLFHAHHGHGHGHGHGHLSREHSHSHKSHMMKHHKSHSHLERAPSTENDNSYDHSQGLQGSQAHNSSFYGQHGIHRADTGHSQTYTAAINRPDSHSNRHGTRTAEINRPNSTMSNHENYNDYGQAHLTQLGVHGHSGHVNPNNNGHGHRHNHGNQHGHSSSHGHGHGHNKRSKHNAEMIPIR
eukprot:CAMPEP_0201573802 /NCGR_PEP_ID=MMETSP0190_2-20130828/17854_1 /ASSEMBLY_ACC=CAM_ASM_000263 /TAXON_ID=37353 /ORGANISM="Rosalina sp." /LENGTH=361 /DNA_ID=CAMNT_0048001199 /DNA_START=580 /DNA_END=1665 /DNA_ORIENTATION=-